MRMNKVHIQFLFVLAAVLILKTQLQSEVKLPAIIGDNMVLQAKKPLPIWGWANPGEEVTVKFGKDKKTTKPTTRVIGRSSFPNKRPVPNLVACSFKARTKSGLKIS